MIVAAESLRQLADTNNVSCDLCVFLVDVDADSLPSARADEVIVRVALAFQVRSFWAFEPLHRIALFFVCL